MGNELTEEQKIQNGERVKNSIADFEKLINNTSDINQLNGFLSYLQDARKQIIEEEGVTYGTDEPAIYTRPNNYTHGYIIYILTEMSRLMKIIEGKKKQFGVEIYDANSINSKLKNISDSIEETTDIDELNNYKLLLEQLELDINLVRNNISENDLNGILFHLRETYSRLVAKMNFIDGLEEDIRGINR